jgi:hypothetical protein
LNDFKAKALKIYGEADAKAEARQMIKEEVDRLARLETTVTLDQAFFHAPRACGTKNGLLARIYFRVRTFHDHDKGTRRIQGQIGQTH